MGVGDRVAHTRLRGQMHYAIKPMLIEQRSQCGAISHVDRVKGKARLPFKSRKTGQLERRFVVIVEVVDTDDPRARGQQAGRGRGKG